MLKKIKYAAGLAIAVTIFAIMLAVSVKERPSENSQPANINHSESMNSSTESGALGFGPDSNPLPEEMPVAEPQEESPLATGQRTGIEELAILDSLDFDDVRDVDLDFDRAILATAGGVLEFFTEDSSFAIYSHPQDLLDYDSYAVLAVDDEILVGTSSGVYRIDPFGTVTRVWNEINDTVTVIKDSEGFIYVGTRNQGLFEINENIVTHVLENKDIIDVSDDDFALWCATSQDGLMYRDVNGWHKRRLMSNPDAFDSVTALESAFGKLWVGTPHGLYLYNGDNWTAIDSSDYLFDQAVTALAAGKSYMYIGTANEGIFAYYDGWLSPLDWSDNLPVTSLDIYDGKYLTGLDKGGALLNSRKGAVDILPLVRQAQTILSIL